jgi:hypothetical protein
MMTLRNAALISALTAAASTLSAQQPTTAATNTPRPLIDTNPSAYLPHPGSTSTSYAPGQNKSSNMKLLAHVPLGNVLTISDIEVEQDVSRPYAYVTRRLNPSGFAVIDLSKVNDGKAKVLCDWRIENAELHQGAGSLNPIYFKLNGRYYLTDAFQFAQGGPDNDLGADVFDVTGLPNCALIKKVAEMREPEFPGGYHETFAYRHSDGHTYFFAQTSTPFAFVYDLAKVIANKSAQGALVGKVPVPEGANTSVTGGRAAYHDFYVQYDPTDHKDKFYGAGAGGYYIYDVTDVTNPRLITAITGVNGVTRGHTFVVDPLGRYASTEAEYQYAPLRFWDLKPNGKDNVPQINRSIGAWTAQWQDLPHNMDMRWPYMFVSAYEDGVQVVNVMDPTNPITTGFYDTYDGPHNASSTGVMMGAWGVKVRNADGLIVASDLQTGFWAFHMEGFDGWNGHDWGMPNLSSAQDWDNGPDGAPKPGAKPVT